MKDLEILAAFTHGLGVAVNLLGILYHVRQIKDGKSGMKDIIFHSVELAYHGNAVRKHYLRR